MARKSNGSGNVVVDLRATAADNGADTDDDDDEDAPEIEKQKRERVDLEKLDPNERVQTGITLPAGLKLKIQDEAESQDVSISTFVRNLLAERYGYVIPKTTRTRKAKYATEEERTAARKASMEKRQNLIKMLMAKYKAGEIDGLDLNGLGEEEEEEEDTEE